LEKLWCDRPVRNVARQSAVMFLLVLSAACGPGRGDMTVEPLSIRVTVLPDGSAQVQEEFIARFGPSPVGEFRRRVPVWRHDGVSDVIATLDGQTLPAGAGAGHVHVGPGPALDVRWKFEPASVGEHAFTLRYRAAHVVSVSGIRGTVSWLAIPATQTFDAANVSVSIVLPSETVLLQDPWVEEANWHVLRQPNGMTASRTDVSQSESATAGMEFTIDHLAVVTPQWQLDDALMGEFIPAFLSAAAFILVIGAGVLVMLRFKYPPWPGGPGGVRAAPRARRQFQRTLATRDDGPALIDGERVGVARDLRIASVAVILLGLAGWVFVAIAITQFGRWPLVVPWSILVVGGMFLAGAARFDVLSEQGAKACVLYSDRVRDERTSV
jgi:hypothetical protein